MQLNIMQTTLSSPVVSVVKGETDNSACWSSPVVDIIIDWRGQIERSLAVLLLIILSPLFLIIATAIKLTSSGRIFFQQHRFGIGGQVFQIMKFRTMIDHAERLTGPTLSWRGDPRITLLGNFLRRSHLDEMPQLVNIMRGEMSFIGPRPERPEFVSKFVKTIPDYLRRHNCLPGITGLAQILCDYDAKPDAKLVHDLLYLERRSSWRLNILIIWRTVLKMSGLNKLAQRNQHIIRTAPVVVGS